MTHTWELQKGKVLVVEDANTASLVIVGKDLKNRQDKITALERYYKICGVPHPQKSLTPRRPNYAINSDSKKRRSAHYFLLPVMSTVILSLYP